MFKKINKSNNKTDNKTDDKIEEFKSPKIKKLKLETKNISNIELIINSFNYANSRSTTFRKISELKMNEMMIYSHILSEKLLSVLISDSRNDRRHQSTILRILREFILLENAYILKELYERFIEYELLTSETRLLKFLMRNNKSIIDSEKLLKFISEKGICNTKISKIISKL